ncbi:hypothetical protein [Calothrix sp. 336/3]|uniref:hypothetical protein n=1 Tax=Calothrix sp. 336/3 TaxID=1337936 RepID=UPI0004E458A5|nr:hypothetical protein [Calothrix sp. 336/3]AKG21576.1 hypothetical protein IJ00_10080 [Calothrix sp. 336/3]
MNTIINQAGYPIFLPNQVLRNNDLNQLVEYLDNQNQLTRTHLIGMGIVAGMEVTSRYTKEATQVSAKIYVSPGCGITSEGYLVDFKSKIKLTHYQDVKVLSSLFTLTKKVVSNTVIPSCEVIELFTEGGDKRTILHQNPDGNQRDVQEFQQFIGDRVLVVVCETLDTQSDLCLFEYDELSKYRSFNWRFFLVPRTQSSDNSQQLSAETLLKTNYQIPEQPWEGLTVENIFNARNHFLQEFDGTTQKFQDFAPQVQRFGYGEAKKSVDLGEIDNYQAFWDNYYQICSNAIASINSSFPKLFWLFSPFFNGFQPNSSRDFNQLQQRLQTQLEDFRKQETTSTSEQIKPPEPPYGIQYFYDYLSQLVAAFYELAETAFDLIDDYPPEIQRFPKFLMLGLVPPPSPFPIEPDRGYALTSPYRSHFTQPPIYNSNRVRLQEVRYLYERLLKLSEAESFCLLPFYNTPLKITPSQDRSAPLSKQAIPYYLNYPNLYKYWSYDAYRKGRSDRHPAYFYPKQNPEENVHEFQDWNYRLDGYNFYRIEGHLGKAKDDVLMHIQNYKQRYNLAFDVITLKLDNQASLKDLNISGQFDDLELDFRRMKEMFQKVWTKYESTKNVLLNTLKRSFFDQPGLTVMDSSQLSNFMLERARKPEAYEFVKGDTDKQFKLYVRDANNIPIARYVIQKSDTKGNSISDFEDFVITLSGLSSDVITQQQEIVKDIVNLLSLTQLTYGLVIDLPNNSETYHLKLSTPDKPLSLSQYSLILLSEAHFTVSQIRENRYIIQEPQFQDVETLYGLLRDVPNDFHSTNISKYQIGNPKIAEEINYFELIGLTRAYQRRLEALIKLHLFPQFAQQYSGMEHLGGVPKGGTFVLVYVDREDIKNQLLAGDEEPAIHKLRSLRTEEIQKLAALPKDLYQENIPTWERLFNELQKRKDIVIADFCLPYLCSGNSPAVSYVIARSRPIILLDKTVFCEDDDRPYEFILEPEGGTVKGEGVIFKDSKQYFQPNMIEEASKADLEKGLEVTITFTYAVDDTYDALTVTVYPLPKPNLSVSDGQNFCNYAAPVEIKLAEKTPDNLQLVQVKINDIETNILNPGEYAKEGKAQTVIITALIRNQQTQCENTLIRNVIINPLPVANLSVSNEQVFCRREDTIEIKLPQGTAENIELLQVKINEKDTKVLNLLEYATGDTPETVTITAKIRDRQTQCENTLTRVVTINPLPVADLSVRNGQNFCGNATPVEITLADDTPKNIELIEVKINDIETSTLNPSQYATDGKAQTVTITALIRSQQTKCENILTRVVKINPIPQANLSIRDRQNFCNNAAPVEIKLAEGTAKNVELMQVQINGIETNTFNPREYASDGEAQTVIINAKIRDRQTQCENTLTHTVTINPIPVANLSVRDGQVFCNNANSINITLAEDTAENVELMQVTINDIETKILNPREYASDGEAQTVIITAKIRDRQTQCENTLTRTVTINPIPEADLSVSNGQNFCNNAAPVEIKLAEDTAENVELMQVTINDIETKILNPREYASDGEAQTVIINAKIRDRQTQCENTLTKTVTIHPQPQADFQTAISNINANGFSVRVFDIEPSGENSLTFNWEHDGIANISNPDNNDFTINYNYDFNTWVPDAVVSITLRVQTPPQLGNCTSEPVTKTIPIPIGGVQGFNLLTIRDNRAISTTPLRDDNTFNISEFNPNNEYTIAAITIPPKVGSVVLNYTPPNGESVVMLATNSPYRLDWQPTVGIHRITAEAAREIDGDRTEGTAATVIIRINDDSSDEPEATPNPPTPSTFTLPNRSGILFQPSDEDIAKFQTISQQGKIQPSQILTLDQPHFDSWNQGRIVKEKNLIFSAIATQSHLGRLLAISATTLLLIAGWTYTVSRQTQNQQNPQPASDLRF